MNLLRRAFRKISGSAPPSKEGSDGRLARSMSVTVKAPEDFGDRESNIRWNRHMWGDLQAWSERDNYGYRWGQGLRQSNCAMTPVVIEYLEPHLSRHINLKILELAPGGGRFTAELVRFSREIHLLDMNEACLDICKERFKYYPDVFLYQNDGSTCDVVPHKDFDLIASFDSMVHMTPEVIEGYVGAFSKMLLPGGVLWLDHSGKGQRESGHRTAMTDTLMHEYAVKFGMVVEAQHFRNDHDCISVLRNPK